MYLLLPHLAHPVLQAREDHRLGEVRRYDIGLPDKLRHPFGMLTRYRLVKLAAVSHDGVDKLQAALG